MKLPLLILKIRRGWLWAILLSSFTPAFAEPLPKRVTAETDWPGITASIYQITRLPGNRVALKLIYLVDHTAPLRTYIADRPLKFEFDPNSDKLPTPPTTGFEPYSFKKGGELIDDVSGLIFRVAKAKPEDAINPEPTELLEAVAPDGAFFVGGIFDCPPVNTEKSHPEQRVTFKLPALKTPLKDVPLPREENVPLNFFPKPKTLPLGTPLPTPSSN